MLEKKVYLNKPQLRSHTIFSPEEWAVMARGTGKSQGILAPKSARYLDMMPRCIGVFVGATFQQILTRTLPPIVAGWERMGYIEGIHYVKCQKPSKEFIRRWRWQGPYLKPSDFDYTISWWNGASIQLISQDRSGSSNGMSIDWIMGDEAKLLNRQRLEEELFPANRGTYIELAGNPHHHGKTFTTDMPVGTAGRWILEKEKQMNMDQYRALVTCLVNVQQLNKLLMCSPASQAQPIASKIVEWERLSNELRKGFVYFHKASAIDNIDLLGTYYLKDQYRLLGDFNFKTSILNQEPKKVEDGFYPSLDEEIHGYFSYDYHHFSHAGYDAKLLENFNDCRKDADLDMDSPLHIAIDYNRRIWPIVTAQVHHLGNSKKELRTLSGVHSLYPDSMEQAVDKWSNYYRYMKNRTVYFWFDHTILDVRHRLLEDIIEALQKRGWVVHKCYIGKTDGHTTRYTAIQTVMQENGGSDWIVRFNRDNCKDLLLSMYQAPSIESERGFKKNKKSERDSNFPANEATHYSDAWDTLFVGLVYSKVDYESMVSDGASGLVLL